LLLLLCEPGNFWVRLRVALENARTHKEDRSHDGMHKRFRIVDDQAARLDAVSQPGDEMFAGWRRFSRWCGA